MKPDFPEPPKFDPKAPAPVPRVHYSYDHDKGQYTVTLVRENGARMEFSEKEFDALRLVFINILGVPDLRAERDTLEHDLSELRSNIAWQSGTQQGSL